ncbi:DUF3426 domain-containing protein [Halomonadaceae bacterium KBTZ08]
MATESETLTRCPYCQTRFRVTQRQLEAARGRVRCGHCLYVFNAIEHAEPEKETPTATQARASGSTADGANQSQPASASSQPAVDNDEEDLVFEDDPEEDAQEDHYAGDGTQEEEEFSEDLLNLDAGDRSGFHNELEEYSSGEKLDDDESWAESLLQEIEEEPEPTPPTQTTGGQREPGPKPDLELESELGSEPEPTPKRKPDTTPEEPSEFDFEPTWRSLNADPIVATKPDRWRWLRRSMWLLAITGMAGLLVYQVGWYRFERLALYEPIRPWYDQACEWFGCELPPLVATDQLEPRQLVVRSHPDMADALLLEVSIVNEAGFDQPWPAIALSFSNLNNDVVAQRVFQPDDYLASKEASGGHIPASEGRRVRLALQDPGKDAINYRIEFLPARQ